jgi:hypothetical protein
MPTHCFVFRSGHLTGRTPRGFARFFTPALKDIEMSTDGKASTSPDTCRTGPIAYGMEDIR